MEEISCADIYFGRWIFERLDGKERSLVVAYKNHLQKDTPIEKMRDLMIAVNEIHEKYPEFNMGCVP